MAAKPPYLVPLNVFADVVRIAQGEAPLGDRLKTARARIGGLLADRREYEKQDPDARTTAIALKEQLSRKLKAASTRWLGTEEIRVIRAALVRLDAHMK